MKPFSNRTVTGALVIAGGLAMAAGLPAYAVENPTAVEIPTDVPVQADANAQTNAALDSAACVAGGGDVMNGTSTEAKLSAETTAHQTLDDPNNQLGTSLEGRTLGPVNCVTTALADIPSSEALE